MSEALSLPFFQRVLLAGLLASVVCGVLGTYVVTKRVSALAGGLSHAAFGGVGLGYLLGFDPLLGALAFGVLAGLVVGIGYRRLRSGLDTLTSIVWSVGMALGVVFVAMTPGYAPDLTSYLFGNLLFVPWSYVAGIAALDALILLAVALLYREFQAVCFDEEFVEVSGLPVERLLLLLLALTALAIVTLIRVVGVILAIALLTLPAATARHWADDLRGMIVVATVFGAVCCVAGLLLAFGLSDAHGIAAPPGPLVVLLAAALFGTSSALRALRGRAAARASGTRTVDGARGD